MTERKKIIYLDDALEAIRKLPNAGIHWFVSAEAVFNALLELPSAEPECKKGKWILKKELVPLPWDSDPLDWDNYDEKTHSEWKEYYHCSNCDWKSGKFKGANFCPNCGADMRGEQE